MSLGHHPGRRRLCSLFPEEVQAILELTQMGAELDDINTALAAARQTHAAGDGNVGNAAGSGTQADLLLECLADHLGTAARRISALTVENGELKGASAQFQRLRSALRSKTLLVQKLRAQIAEAQAAQAAAEAAAQAARDELAQARAHFRDKDARTRMEAASRVKRARSALKVDKRVAALEAQLARAAEETRAAQDAVAEEAGLRAAAVKSADAASLRADKAKSQLQNAMAVSRAFEEQVRGLKSKLEATAAAYKTRQDEWAGELDAANARYAEMHSHWSSIHKATIAKLTANSAHAAGADLVAELELEPLRPTRAASRPTALTPDEAAAATEAKLRVAELEALVRSLRDALATQRDRHADVLGELESLRLGADRADELQARLNYLESAMEARASAVANASDGSHPDVLRLEAELHGVRAQLDASRAQARSMAAHSSAAAAASETSEASEASVASASTAHLRAQIDVLRAQLADAHNTIEDQARNLAAAHTAAAAAATATTAPAAVVVSAPPAPSAEPAQLAELAYMRAQNDDIRAQLAAAHSTIEDQARNLAAAHTTTAPAPAAAAPAPAPATPSRMTADPAEPAVLLTPGTRRTDVVLAEMQRAAAEPLTPAAVRGMFGPQREQEPNDDDDGREQQQDLVAKVIALEALNKEKDALMDTMQATFDVLADRVREAQASESPAGRIAVQALLSAAEVLSVPLGHADQSCPHAADVDELGGRVVRALETLLDSAAVSKSSAKAASMKVAALEKNHQTAAAARESEIRSLESQLSSLSFAMEKDAAAARDFRKHAAAKMRAAKDEIARLKRVANGMSHEVSEAKHETAHVKAKLAKWRKDHASCLLHKGGSRNGIRKVLAVLQSSSEAAAHGELDPQAQAPVQSITDVIDSYVRVVARQQQNQSQ